MIRKEFHGIIPYLVSPVNQKTGQIKTDVLKQLSQDLIEKGVHGLSPLGSTGEVHYLTREQKIEVVQTVVDAARGRVPVIPGVSAYTISDAITQINEFVEIGVDGVVLILNTYFPLSKTAIIHFFSTVAKAVKCPIVLYNNPKFSGVDLTPEIIIKLSEEPNIQYVKDATGVTGRLVSIINQAGDKIKIFSASAHIPLFVFQLGGVGWMSGPACLLPKQSIDLYNFANSNQWLEGLDLQKRLWQVNEIFQKYTLAACIKTGLEIQGYEVGGPIPPLSPLNTDDKLTIKKVLDTISRY